MYVRVAIREWLLLILPRGIQFVLATFGLHPETLPNARSSSNSAATLEADASKKISVSSLHREDNILGLWPFRRFAAG